MSLFDLEMCDRAGRVLHSKPVDAADTFAALARANRRLSVMLRAGVFPADRAERIDVIDGHGHKVARLICAEAIAAIS